MKTPLLLLLYLFFTTSASSQICKLVETTENAVKKSFKAHSFEPEQRMSKLKELIEPDSIRYMDMMTANDEEPEYFELDTNGIYLIDLNFDSHLDLIYSAISGPLGRATTTIYLNKKGKKLERKAVIDGRLLDIEQKHKEGLTIHTLWQPCCDSYTNRILSYQVSENEISQVGLLAFIGNTKLRHLPDFSKYDKKTLKKGAIMYAIDTDFKHLSPYFRDDNKAFKEKMRNQEALPMMTVESDLKVSVLLQLEVEVYGELYAAIVTDLFSAPKSHFEWADSENSRIVSWVNP